MEEMEREETIWSRIFFSKENEKEENIWKEKKKNMWSWKIFFLEEMEKEENILSRNISFQRRRKRRQIFGPLRRRTVEKEKEEN